MYYEIYMHHTWRSFKSWFQDPKIKNYVHETCSKRINLMVNGMEYLDNDLHKEWTKVTGHNIQLYWRNLQKYPHHFLFKKRASYKCQEFCFINIWVFLDFGLEYFRIWEPFFLTRSLCMYTQYLCCYLVVKLYIVRVFYVRMWNN